MMQRHSMIVLTVATALCLALPALAHHGVATVGVAGVEGPGAPLETSSSANLPAGHWLAYLKIDHASFDTFTPARDDETVRQTYFMYGLGYGLKPWLSAYAFAPFHAKVAENNVYNTAGFADVSWMLVAGFKWDGGPRLVPERESLDELEDWHFTIYGGSTLPTGDPNLRDAAGTIDPGMATGFGKPAFSLGLTATKTLSSRLTAVSEISSTTFSEYEYEDDFSGKFGSELRLNGALAGRLFSDPSAATRLDLNLEANYLRLGRDQTDGVGEEATGGKILYSTLGLRLTRESVSLAVGWKVPVWTDLNEEDLQQGAEGKESGRLLLTLSTLF
jgi:hypothetical protein